jgi:hypothetical protein
MKKGVIVEQYSRISRENIGFTEILDLYRRIENINKYWEYYRKLSIFTNEPNGFMNFGNIYKYRYSEYCLLFILVVIFRILGRTERALRLSIIQPIYPTIFVICFIYYFSSFSNLSHLPLYTFLPTLFLRNVKIQNRYFPE